MKEIRNDSDAASYMLANNCMPTLMGEKPSSIVHIQKKHINHRETYLNLLNQELQEFNCCYLIMDEREDAFILFIYQETDLINILCRHQNHPLLRVYSGSMEGGGIDRTLRKLKLRFQYYMREKKDFPHELGIFLGYPVKDVEGFIRFQGKQFLFAGYWKVYTNPEQAKKTFRNYDDYRKQAVYLLLSGRKVTEMIQYRKEDEKWQIYY